MTSVRKESIVLIFLALITPANKEERTTFNYLH